MKVIFSSQKLSLEDDQTNYHVQDHGSLENKTYNDKGDEELEKQFETFLKCYVDKEVEKYKREVETMKQVSMYVLVLNRDWDTKFPI